MARIPDLNPLSPTGTDPVSNGDNELRALKDALVGDGTASSGSFTPDFTGQYTGTADELNAVNTAGQAADGISYFDDVDTTGAADGDLLRFNGTQWVKSTPVPTGSAQYSGLASIVGDQVVFTSGTNNVDASLATIDNPATGRGWQLTAATDIELNLSYMNFLQWSLQGDTFAPATGHRSFSLDGGIGLNVSGTAYDDSLGIGSSYQVSPPPGPSSVYFVALRVVSSTNVLLSAGDTVNLSVRNAESGIQGTETLSFINNAASVFLTVRPV